MVRGGYVYILTNKNYRVLYVGVTSDLHSRMNEHLNKVYPNSFSARYNLKKLVCVEVFETIEEAIDREKQLKGGSRMNKVELIDQNNPSWRDLMNEIEDIQG